MNVAERPTACLRGQRARFTTGIASKGLCQPRRAQSPVARYFNPFSSQSRSNLMSRGANSEAFAKCLGASVGEVLEIVGTALVPATVGARLI